MRQTRPQRRHGHPPRDYTHGCMYIWPGHVRGVSRRRIGLVGAWCCEDATRAACCEAQTAGHVRARLSKCMKAAPGIVAGSAYSSLALASACDDRYSVVRAVVEGRLYGRRCGVMGSDSRRWRPRACVYARESPELCTEAAGSIASGSVRRVAASAPPPTRRSS